MKRRYAHEATQSEQNGPESRRHLVDRDSELGREENIAWACHRREGAVERGSKCSRNSGQWVRAIRKGRRKTYNVQKQASFFHLGQLSLSIPVYIISSASYLTLHVDLERVNSRVPRVIRWLRIQDHMRISPRSSLQLMSLLIDGDGVPMADAQLGKDSGTGDAGGVFIFCSYKRVEKTVSRGFGRLTKGRTRETNRGYRTP